MERKQELNSNKEFNHLVIESITLLDGETPDERVHYKVGRKVLKLIGANIGSPFFVFYDEKRGWRTNPVHSIEEGEERIVLKDNLSIYTFKKGSTPV